MRRWMVIAVGLGASSAASAQVVCSQANTDCGFVNDICTTVGTTMTCDAAPYIAEFNGTFISVFQGGTSCVGGYCVAGTDSYGYDFCCYAPPTVTTIDITLSDSGDIFYASDYQFFSGANLTAAGADPVTLILNGGAGDDYLFLTPGDASVKTRVYGGDGIDYFYGGAGKDHLYGEGGNDVLLGGGGGDSLYGGIGNDVEEGGIGNDTIFGGDGADVLTGDGGADTMAGGKGNDQMCGDGGIDAILGEGGNDHIASGAGNDSVDAGPGLDVCDDVGDTNCDIQQVGQYDCPR